MADQEFRIKKGLRVQDVLTVNDQGNIAHVDRLPDIPIAKVTGLQDALDASGGGSGQGYIGLSNRRLLGLGAVPLTSTNLSVTDRIYFQPLIVLEEKTFIRLGTRVSTRNGGNIWVALYDDNNGKPGNRLEVSSAFSVTGTLEHTINRTLPSGVYWLAVSYESVDNITVPVVQILPHEPIEYMGTSLSSFVWWNISGGGLPPEDGSSAFLSTISFSTAADVISSSMQFPVVWVRESV
jgi:hypothetical protein